jgi:hypothetical protein
VQPLIDGQTLTKTQYEELRSNGTAPTATAAAVQEPPSVRRCEVCSTPLRPTQKRVCSPRCAARLGGAVAKAKASQRGGTGTKTKTEHRPMLRSPPREHGVHPEPGVHADGLLALIATLPDEVVALELVGGWRCVRT